MLTIYFNQNQTLAAKPNMTPFLLMLAVCPLANAFVLQRPSHPSIAPIALIQSQHHSSTALFFAKTDAATTLESSVQSNLQTLYRAADTKSEESDSVYAALSDLEKEMRQLAKQDKKVATDMLAKLDGDWRLVFTTGTAKTQQKFGKVNYFPLKAVQSFRPSQNYIENGIYVGDFCILKFSGDMDFDLRKRRLEFDFDTIYLFNCSLKVPLKKGQAADLGSKSGLGSDSNVANAERNKRPFFNWISADDKIATARGGGGGLALWKRV